MKVYIMNFTQIENDFENMRKDLEKLACSTKLIGGMKTRGFSTHDVDILVIIPREEAFEKIDFLFRKYNKAGQE